MGIAVGSGTDVAIEAADYVLMRSDLVGLADLSGMSRQHRCCDVLACLCAGCP